MTDDLVTMSRERLTRAIGEAVSDAVRHGIGEAIRITEHHQYNDDKPELFDALLAALRTRSAQYAMPEREESHD